MSGKGKDTEDRWEEIERVGSQPQPSDAFFAAFCKAAAAASVFELKMRLLADNTEPLRKRKTEKLDALVKRAIEHFTTLRPEEQVLIKKCARLRNKLLHADFSCAAGTLLSFGSELEQGHVQQVELKSGDVHKVSDISATSDEGRVFGWVMEGARSKMFDESVKLFARGLALIHWLLAEQARTID
jgi:hypothetical protein